MWTIAGNRHDHTTTGTGRSLAPHRPPTLVRAVLCCSPPFGDSLAPCLPQFAMRPLALGALLMLALMMLMANSATVQAATDAAAADVAVAATHGQQQSETR